MMAAFGGGAIIYSLSARRLLAWLGERGLALGGGLVLCVGYLALAMASSSFGSGIGTGADESV